MRTTFNSDEVILIESAIILVINHMREFLKREGNTEENNLSYNKTLEAYIDILKKIDSKYEKVKS